MANKVLEKTLNNVEKDDMKPGYAAPTLDPSQSYGSADVPPGNFVGTSDTMSTTGSARVALFLFGLVVAAGAWAWVTVPESAMWPVVFVAMIVGLIFAMITIFKPQSARMTAPIYALAEGVVLGLISRIYEDQFNGIVVQAVLATGAIVFVMYTLYSTGILKVTPRFRKVVIGATLAICLFYVMNMVLMIFGAQMPLIGDTGPWGIAFSAIIICVAASNLALDFDFIERGSAAGLPKYMDWAAGFGLIVTIVWIYLEVLRLLAKVRS